MFCSRVCIPTFFSIVLTLAALAPADALAQSPYDPGEWLVSPALGIAFDADADVSPALAGAIGYPVTQSLIIEAELGHLFDLAPGDADVDSSLTTIHAAALYFFETEYVAAPYVAGGIGIGHFSHDVTTPRASISQTEIGVNLGGGVSYPIRDRVLARGDLRFFKHIDDVPSAWRLAAMVTFALRR
jgi:hypothetical protein